MFKQLNLVCFLFVTACASAPPKPASLAEKRLTPPELTTTPEQGSQIGSSGLPGVHTRVLFGDPAKSGFYSVLLYVPAGTTIQAHSHRDDRVATVLSGTWHFGYGDHFDAAALKELPPGSIYSEPGLPHNHFARTEAEPVVVHITGYGPTDTHYFNPVDQPEAREP